MEKMELYNAVRTVPDHAKKTISAGRIKGMTDINPMWRIQSLTEQFGPCGFGWKYVIRDKRLEQGANGEASAFVDIDLYYKVDDQWSDPVPGTGGASFIAKERNGLYTSDECFKMALTDALSVACKALGVGADVYWAAGRSKYSSQGNGDHQEPRGRDDQPNRSQFNKADIICSRCGKRVLPIRKDGEVVKTAEDLIEYTKSKFQSALCYACMKELTEHESA